MSHEKVGPKELAQRMLQQRRMAARNGKKLSTADLRDKIAKIKPMAKHGGRRGR